MMGVKERTWMTLTIIYVMFVFIAISNGNVSPYACTTKLGKRMLISGPWIKASSHSSGTNPVDAIAGGWCANKHLPSQHWIEVDFPTDFGIRGIILRQPTAQAASQSFPKNVSVQYQPLGSVGILTDYLTQAGVLTIALNSTLATSTIRFTGIATRRIRLNLNSWHGDPCLSFDLLGCMDPTDLCPAGCENGGQCQYEDTCMCTGGHSGSRCQVSSCHPTPLGLSDGRITSDHITSSSEDAVHRHENVGSTCCKAPRIGGWCPAQDDAAPWLQVKLNEPMAISMLDFSFPERQTGEAKQFMETFDLRFTVPEDSSQTFRTFAKRMPALNGTHSFSITLVPSVVTDTVRLVPSSYTTRPCFRLELGGCNPATLCSPSWCQNMGTCNGENTCSCPAGYYGYRCQLTKIPETKFNFMKIDQNILQTSSLNFTVNGNVALLATGSNHTAVMLTGTGSSIVMEPTQTPSCITNIALCTSGFTISFELKFDHLLDNTYIVSSGGNLPNSTGLALFYNNKQLTYIVSTNTQIWHLTVHYEPKPNVWQHVEITWSKSLGIALLLDGHLIGSSRQPGARPAPATIANRLCFGCSHQHTTVNAVMMFRYVTSWDLERTDLVKAGKANAPEPPFTTSKPSQTSPPTSMIGPVATTTTLAPMTSTKALATTLPSTSLVSTEYLRVQPLSQNVNVGDNVTLDCLGNNGEIQFYIENRVAWTFTDVRGNATTLTYGFYPAPKLEARFRHKKYSLDYGTVIQPHQTPLFRFRLNITAVSPSDSGVYTCSMNAANGSEISRRQMRLNVTVSVPPCEDDPRFNCSFLLKTFNVCTDKDHAKVVCRKSCKFCDVVDGVWGQWTVWSGCPVTCGVGNRTRTRVCDSPTPVNGGDSCLGSNAETNVCTNDPCIVDGGWSNWSSWSSCSVTCGPGIQQRRRTCSNPTPAASGQYCVGDAIDSRSCQDDPCPVDGGWSSWLSWSSCSVTCGTGTRHRSRSCSNPIPSRTGHLCVGYNHETGSCKVKECQVTDHWSDWTCGPCQPTVYVYSCVRTCISPLDANGYPACRGSSTKVVLC